MNANINSEGLSNSPLIHNINNKKNKLPKVLILGATSDMAKSFARHCCSLNYDVILSGRNINALELLSEDLFIRSSKKPLVVKFDALDFKAHKSFYINLPFKPDIVACFIGFLANEKECSGDFMLAKKVIDTNFTGIASIFNIVADDFEDRSNGIIIAISSVAGDRGRSDNYHYASAKSSLSTYLSGLRNRLSYKNIQVIDVKSGFCRTRMTEGLNLPSFLTCEPKHISNAIFRAIELKQNIIYVSWMWRWIMLVIRIIPDFIFKKMKF